MEFLEETRFERVGVFTYSPQEGTRAAELPDDVPEDVKLERLERVTDLQRAITAEVYESRLGTPAAALVDRIDPESGLAEARFSWQADDIDGITRLDVAAAPGTLVEAIPTAVVDDYDFEATVTRVIDAPVQGAAAKPRRHLPLAGSTIGSFGR